MTNSTIRAHNTTTPYAEAGGFLKALFENAPGDQFLEIRNIHHGKRQSRQTWHKIGDLRKHGFHTALPIGSNGKTNPYYGIAPRITRRGQEQDVTVAGAVWLDEITRAASNLPPFSFMVETSPGKIQGGYFLDAYTEDLALVNTLNRRLAAAVGGDNVGDLPRIHQHQI